jgi:hypothetical protein
MKRKLGLATVSSLYPKKENTVFQTADVLYATGWATLAPGIDGWRIAVDADVQTTLVSVTPPGSEFPVFLITREGQEAIVKRQTDGRVAEVGRFAGLRNAILALCPLDDDRLEELNTRMEILYPRSLRGPSLVAVRDD